MAQQIFTVPNWVATSNTFSVILNAALVEGGATAYARELNVVGGNAQFRTAPTPTGVGAGAGPDMSDAWETYESAITLTDGNGNSIVLKGPNHPDNAYAEGTEPYFWTPDNGAALSNWSGTASGTTVTIILDDGVAGPTADAGDDQTVDHGVTVTLDGSGSAGLTHAWGQTSGDDVVLSSSSAILPTFTAPTTNAEQTLTFELTITDDQGNSDTDTVDITVRGVPLELSHYNQDGKEMICLALIEAGTDGVDIDSVYRSVENGGPVGSIVDSNSDLTIQVGQDVTYINIFSDGSRVVAEDNPSTLSLEDFLNNNTDVYLEIQTAYDLDPIHFAQANIYAEADGLVAYTPSANIAELSGVDEGDRFIFVLARDIEPTIAQADPVTVTFTVPSVTGQSRPPHFTGQADPVTLSLNVPSVMGQTIEPVAAQADPVTLSLNVPSVMGQTIEPVAGQADPVTLSLNVPSVMGQTIEPVAGQADPVTLSLNVPSVMGVTHRDLFLSDFVQPNLTAVVCAALMVASDTENYYADSDRGGTDSPLDGELGLSATETVISRIRRDTALQLILNDNDSPVALAIGDYFSLGEGLDATIHVQTLDGVESFVVDGAVDAPGGNFIRFNIPSALDTLLQGIAIGDRFILAITVPDIPHFTGEADPVTVTFTVPSVTGQSRPHFTAQADPVTATFTVPSVTGRTIEPTIAQADPVTATFTVPSVMGQTIAPTRGQADPVTVTFTVPSVTGRAIAPTRGQADPVTATFTVPSVRGQTYTPGQPEPPQNVMVSTANNEDTVTFDPPDDTGNSPGDYYEVEVEGGDGRWYLQKTILFGQPRIAVNQLAVLEWHAEPPSTTRDTDRLFQSFRRVVGNPVAGDPVPGLWIEPYLVSRWGEDGIGIEEIFAVTNSATLPHNQRPLNCVGV